METDSDLVAILLLLRTKIRECGHTQLIVQAALGWGRSYISQILTKQKLLRVDQLLAILRVIEVEPAQFFAEVQSRRVVPWSIAAQQAESTSPGLDTTGSRALLVSFVRALFQRGLVTIDEVLASPGQTTSKKSGPATD